MRTVRRSAPVRFNAAQMFDLVSDVTAYPQFLHWCREAVIERRSEHEIEATLDVGVGGLHKRFTTRNRLQRPGRIDISLVEGPFRELAGAWTFDDRGDAGCQVSLTLDFDVAHTPLATIFAIVFEELARSQMAAFIERAEALYG